jgi:MoaA/NifB/PqqE/SkfB family radical SAM enzyme
MKNSPITYAYLETTNYCNLNCSFCNRNEVIGKLQHMSIPNWKKLLNSIKHHPITDAKLMGMGEPFLHPQFDEICRLFKETFPNSLLIVATNCQYDIKSGKKMRIMYENSLKYIDMLYLSIDGYKESYERDRYPAKWDKLIDFLDNFGNIDKNSCNTVINYVVNKNNIQDIQKIEELRIKYDLSELRLNIAQDWNEHSSISNDYTEEDINYLKAYWLNNIKGKSKWDFSDCFWVSNGLYTTVEGNVKMCCMNTGATPFGNIFNNTIEEIRNTEQYQDVKNGCQTNNPTSHCKNCSYNELVPILKKIL